MTSSENYRLLLARFLEEKKRLNPSYSLRALARNLRISPASLSQMISGKRPLSKKTALRIAHSSVVSQEIREAMLVSIRAGENGLHGPGRVESETIELETFRAIANWYHFAILSLTRLHKHSSEPGWVAKRLGITLSQARGAVKRLKSLNLLSVREGRMKQTSSRLTTKDDIPDDAIRLFHQQILEKASHSLDHDPVDKREFSCEILAVNLSQLDQIKEEIRRFKLAVNQLTRQTKHQERVYSLSIQFFPLDHNRER